MVLAACAWRTMAYRVASQRELLGMRSPLLPSTTAWDGTTGALQFRRAHGRVGGDRRPLIGALGAVPEEDEAAVAPAVLRVSV